MPDPQMEPSKPAKSTAAATSSHGSGGTAALSSMTVNASIDFGSDGVTATIDIAKEQIDQTATNVSVWWNTDPRLISTVPTDTALDALHANYTASNTLKIVVSYVSGPPDTYIKNNIAGTAGTTASVTLNRL
jgi:hypothetical protein